MIGNYKQYDYNRWLLRPEIKNIAAGYTGFNSEGQIRDFLLNLYKYLIQILQYFYTTPRQILHITPHKYQYQQPPPETFTNDKLIESLMQKLDINSQRDLSYFAMMNGYAGLLSAAAVTGLDSARTKTFLQFLNLTRTRERQYSLNKIHELKNLYLSNLLLFLIEQKLPSAAIREFMDKWRARPIKSIKLLSYLSAEHAAFIKLEYENRIKYFAALSENKCAHIAAVKKLRAAPTAAALASVLAFNSLTEKNKLRCNVCNYELICAHVVRRAQLQNAAAQYEEIKREMSKFTHAQPILDKYYCKFCNEVIEDLDPFAETIMADNTAIIYSSISDSLRNEIWGELNNVLTRYFIISAAIPLKKLLKIILNTVWEYLYEIEKYLIQSKANSDEELALKKSLFINIYIYAAVINLILQKPKDIQFRELKGKTTLIDYLKLAIFHIMSSKSSVISRLKNITVDYVKEKTIDAYKIIAKQIITIPELDTLSNRLYSRILNDPIYYLLYNQWALSTDQSKNYIDDAIRQLPAVLHISDKNNLDKLNFIYEKFDSCKTPDACLFIKELMRISKNLREYVFSGDGEESVTYSAYTAELLQLRRREQQLKIERSRKFYRSVQRIEFATPEENYRRFKYTPAKLSLSYDENGNEHKWTIAVLNDKNQNTAEVSINDLQLKIMNAQPAAVIPWQLPPVDLKCATCGVLKSRTDTLDEAAIHAALVMRAHILAFFAAITNYCVGYFLHKFDTSGKCTQCGVTLAMIKNPLSDASKNYYNAHHIKLESAAAGLRQNASIASIEPPPPQLIRPEYKYDYNNILKLIKFLNINSNIILNLGNTEGHSYKDIETTIIIRPNYYKQDHRLYVIDSYIQKLIIEYNKLRNLNMILTPADYVLDLLKKYNVMANQYIEFQKLTKYGNEYRELLKWIIGTRSGQEIIDFCLEYFCKLCNDIAAAGGICGDFVREICRQIIKQDELISHATIVNWNAFKKEMSSRPADIANSETYDENLDADAGLELEDDFIEEKEENDDDFGDTDAVMEYNYDVDVEEGEDFENESPVDD